MHPLRRALPGGPSPNRLSQRRRYPLRPLRSRQHQADFLLRPPRRTHPHHVALRRRSSRCEPRHPRRRLYSHALQPRVSQRLHQGRRPKSDRIFQSSWTLRRRYHGAPLPPEEARYPFSGQRRRAARRLVAGLSSDCARKVADLKNSDSWEKAGWFDVSPTKEPYRVEGKKTMGYEVAEQLGWKLPQGIIYPTGGGVGLLGML